MRKQIKKQKQKIFLVYYNINTKVIDTITIIILQKVKMSSRHDADGI